jgi:hypothetical protein
MALEGHPDRLVLILLIDALGHHLAGDRSFMPFLERERAPVRSVLGYSSAAIPTLLTGELPVRHGHFSMYRRSGKEGVFGPYRLLLRLAAHSGGREWRFRQWLTRSLRRGGLTGYFSLYDIPLSLLGRFDLCQRLDPFAPGAFPGMDGLTDHIALRARGRIWNWSVPEERAWAELEEEVERGERKVLFLYTAELDALMHAHGPQSEAARRRLREYETRLSGVLSHAARKGRETRVFVFGDHGMAPVSRVHDLWGGLRALPFRMPQDYLLFLDSTMARFWFFNQAARRGILDFLAPIEYGRLLPEAELDRLGALFPGADYGEAIFLLHEGEIAVPSFMGREAPAAMHGYHPDGLHSSTTLCTNVLDHDYPRDLCALHRLLREEILEVAG